MELALYQPDIAPNVGTLMRMGACLGLKVNIIEPCGFPFGAKDMRRAAMDYAQFSDVERHSSFERFCENRRDSRLVLLTTKSAEPYTDFTFHASDILLLGQESKGVPEEVHNRVQARITIPMQQGMRSVNVAIAAAMVTSEALRQTGGFPTSD
ncbi:tRNA (cytidine(34)-2'-O)-methyltransferase [Sneathiella aquimaris]|uniref:tRNA (cytidine(34)-2'-O)-methyltransferase n=1 Tax=Sneathiella aquimaris TaxID=2599305 RepID=UPI00146E2592|nr:tRNA (cytidine(34)-2'-O)-methyltransferase [Sneathiella aquimaris]